jgi:hypothetical protein
MTSPAGEMLSSPALGVSSRVERRAFNGKG